MINPYLLRHQIDIIYKKLETRGFILDKKYLFLIEKKRKELQIDFENLRNKYKKLSQIIGKNKNIQTSIIDLKKFAFYIQLSKVFRVTNLASYKTFIRSYLLSVIRLKLLLKPPAHVPAAAPLVHLCSRGT